MTLSVLGGLSLRVLANESCHPVSPAHASESCCHGDHDHHGSIPEKDSDKSGDKDQCPPEPHHHQGCVHILPLTVENHFSCRVSLPHWLLLGISHDRESPPDEPFLSSEKPPLI